MERDKIENKIKKVQTKLAKFNRSHGSDGRFSSGGSGSGGGGLGKYEDISTKIKGTNAEKAIMDVRGKIKGTINGDTVYADGKSSTIIHSALKDLGFKQKPGGVNSPETKFFHEQRKVSVSYTMAGGENRLRFKNK